MKKIIGLLAAVLAIVWGCALADAPVFNEAEPNDSRDQAQVLCLNAVMEGTLGYGSGNESDWYRLIVPENGRIKVNFEHNYIDTSSRVNYLRVYYPASDQQVWWASVNGNKASYSYYSFYLGAGEYDLQVESASRDALEYRLRVQFSAQANVETEWNNTPETADPIRPNEDYEGSISIDKDVDYYLLSLPEAGGVQFHFQHEYFDNGSTYYRVNITKGIGGQTVRAIDFSGQDSDWTSYPFYLSAGDYYIRIEQNYYSDRPYQFRISYTPDALTELENNDSFKNATKIPLNTPIKGSFAVKDDVDVYRFELTEPGMVTFYHEHEYFDNGSTYYVVSMYDDARSDAEMFTENLTGRNNDWTRYRVYLPAGTYYLQYKTNYYTTRPYTFTLRFTAMSNIEIERNNSYNAATGIQPNADYYGSLMTDKDADYYTFTLAETSWVRINFNFTYFDNGSTYFKLALDTDAKSGTTYLSASLSGRNSDYVSNPFYLAAGTYYFRVESNYFTARPYCLRIDAEPCVNAELEWNNSYESATPMAIGQPMNGALRYDRDVDYYALTVTSATTLRIRFEHEWFDDGSTYFKLALDARPNNSQRLNQWSVRGRDGELVSEALTLQPGTYFISVDSNYHTTRPYVLTAEPAL